QQVQVCPKDRACYRRGGMQQVVVVVPVDADINETQDVAEEDRQYGQQVVRFVAVRYFHFQHHDRDDDRNPAVAETLQSSRPHLPSPLTRLAARRTPSVRLTQTNMSNVWALLTMRQIAPA